jgi:hypothetical protein
MNKNIQTKNVFNILLEDVFGMVMIIYTAMNTQIKIGGFKEE